MSDRTEANEETDPGSFDGMKKAIAKSCATSDKSLEWSVKTYDIVTRIEKRVNREEGAKTLGTILVSVGVSLLTSALVVSCSMAGR